MIVDEAGEVVERPIWRGEPLQQWAQRVFDLLGIEEPSVDVPLHRTFVATLVRLGVGQPLGTYLSALRFDVAWSLREQRTSSLKVEATYQRERAVARLMAGGGAQSEAAARRLAAGVLDVIEAERRLAAAQDEARFLRAILGAIDAGQDMHRTDRADERAQDAWHGRAATGVA